MNSLLISGGHGLPAAMIACLKSADLEIGRPFTSEQHSETADGIARESEGRTRLPLLRPLRQDQPRRHSGACLCPVSLQQGRAGRDRQDFEDIEAYGVGRWLGELALALRQETYRLIPGRRGARLLRRGRLRRGRRIGRICNLGRGLRSDRLIVFGMLPGCVSRGGRPRGLHAVLEHDLLRS